MQMSGGHLLDAGSTASTPSCFESLSPYPEKDSLAKHGILKPGTHLGIWFFVYVRGLEPSNANVRGTFACRRSRRRQHLTLHRRCKGSESLSPCPDKDSARHPAPDTHRGIRFFVSVAEDSNHSMQMSGGHLPDNTQLSQDTSCAYSPCRSKAWFIGPLPLPKSSIAARAPEM